MTESEIRAVCEEYCSNDMRKLRFICGRFIRRIGGLSQMDHDDFLSRANELVWLAAKDYDETKAPTFHMFLVGCIKRKFDTEIRDRNRDKRIPVRKLVSLDTPLDEEGHILAELLPGDFDIHAEAFGESETQDIKMERYLQRLSKKQHKVVRLLMTGYQPAEIQDMLRMSGKEYADCLKAIKAYENIKLLL